MRELRLVDSSLSDTHMQSVFSNFNLQEFFLYNNRIILSSPPYLNFPSLVSHYISYNNMLSLVFQGCLNISSKLQYLDLTHCSLMDGSFFMSSTSIMNSLSFIVSHITNMLPKSIGLLSELNILSLEGIVLEGDVLESHLSNFSKLETLQLSQNYSVKFAPSWVPIFQLDFLRPRSCKLGSTFPS